MRAAGQAERLERELVELSGRVDGHGQSLAREFDRVLDVLDRRGYVDADGVGADRPRRGAGAAVPRVRPARRRVPARRACSTASTRRRSPGCCRCSSTSTAAPSRRRRRGSRRPTCRDRWRRISATSEDLAADERSVGLAEHRPPDPGFVAAAHAWVAGEGLAEVVGRRGADRRRLRAHDEAARRPGPPGRPRGARRRRPAERAREVAERAFRGVVADGVVGRRCVEAPPTDDDPAAARTWGEPVARAADGLVDVASDADARRARSSAATSGRCGSSAATCCARSADRRPGRGLQRVPDRRAAGRRRRASARSPSPTSSPATGRGGAGPIVAVMNVDRLGRWDVAPRAHPNDGALDVVEVDAAMGVRARWQARRRLPTGTHVPHPAIRTRRGRPSAAWTFDRPLAAVGRRRRAGHRTLARASPSSPTVPSSTPERGALLDAWILDESPGSYRWGDDRPAAARRRRRAHPGRRQRPQPHGPVGHAGPAEAAAAARPGCDVAGVVDAVGDAVTDVAVGDEVVVNPGVSPVADIVALGNDSPMGPGFAIYGEHTWGGHATLRHRPGPQRRAAPGQPHAGRSARRTRWRR